MSSFLPLECETDTSLPTGHHDNPAIDCVIHSGIPPIPRNLQSSSEGHPMIASFVTIGTYDMPQGEIGYDLNTTLVYSTRLPLQWERPYPERLARTELSIHANYSCRPTILRSSACKSMGARRITRILLECNICTTVQHCFSCCPVVCV